MSESQPIDERAVPLEAQKTLAVAPCDPLGDTLVPSNPPEPPTSGTAGRNLLFDEIAHGGMGAVFRGQDPTLGRELAVKILLEEHRHNPELTARFLEEAQIAGQLQHPGVVPVYELGHFQDNRPFFTMKLVKGQTLETLLKQRAHPSDNLPRFLTIFEQICQTVAYAHARGVIHRDLKPLNVMVGSFGEVQVMDWGLAKVLTRSVAAAETPAPAKEVTHIRTRPADGQRAGTLFGMGTFGYMPPEQALGEADQIDERADVFALGAILCVILTGQPPYVGTAEEVRRQTVRGDLAAAYSRLDASGADAELIRLAKYCLAARPEERPRDAGQLAQAVTAYLESVAARLRQAELARTAAEVQAREERKRRKLGAALAAALLLLVAGGGGGAWWAQSQRQARAAEIARRQQEADGAVQQAMAEARLLREQARTAPLGDASRFREAVAAARKAVDLARAGEASEEVCQQATDLADLADKEEAAAQRDRRLLAALLEVRGPREGPRFQRDDKGLMVELVQPSADEQFAAAFREWDPTFDVDTLSMAEAAIRLRVRPVAVLLEVVAALDEWASERRQQQRPAAPWRRVADLARVLDEDTKRQELRSLLADGNLARERALGLLSAALRPVPVPCDSGLGDGRSRLRQLATQVDAAAEPVLGLLTLARALRLAGEEALAERLLRSAVRARPQEVVLRVALGDVFASRQPPRWAEAVEQYEAARALRPDLGEALANALVGSGRVEDGLALYQRLTVERPENPWLHFRHGYALGGQGRFPEAEAAYRAGLRLKPDVPAAHNNLGNALKHQGRFTEAEAAVREALRLQPDDPMTHSNLGAVLNDQGRFQEAEAALRVALRLDPDYPSPHHNLGIALSDQGRYPEAEAAYRAALRLKPNLPETHTSLGAALYHQGRFKEAEAAFHEALRLKPDDPVAQSNLGAVLNDQEQFQEAEVALRAVLRLAPDYPPAHFNLGNALGGQGRFQEAAAAFRAVLRLKPDYLPAHLNLGNALGSQGRFQEAAAAFRAALRLKSDLPEAHLNLGNALKDQGRYLEAEAAYRAALRLEPNDPVASYSLGTVLLNQRRFKEAEAAFRATLRLKPDYPEAHCNLGHVLTAQGRFPEALESLRRGDALGGQTPGWNYPSRQWVRQGERLVELDRKVPALLKGDAQPTSAAERLELASLCQRPCKSLHAAAARFYAAAFAAEPKLADDLSKQYRYNAACSAVLAGVGQAADATQLDAPARSRLRQQALDWLRADLAAWTKRAGDAKEHARIRQTLQHWQRDSDLAGIRDKDAVVKLPAAEQQGCQKLWADVEALRKKTQGVSTKK
jgi:serine/threonine-protein kinase